MDPLKEGENIALPRRIKPVKKQSLGGAKRWVTLVISPPPGIPQSAP
jgi:hypothetical protein